MLGVASSKLSLQAQSKQFTIVSKTKMSIDTITERYTKSFCLDTPHLCYETKMLPNKVTEQHAKIHVEPARKLREQKKKLGFSYPVNLQQVVSPLHNLAC